MAIEIDTQQFAERLADTVRTAIVEHATAIAQGSGQCRALHVEIELTRAGLVSDLAFWTEYKLKPGELVGLGGSRKR